MPNKFCPAGKIECVHFSTEINRCGASTDYLATYEQCPWPARQQPVAKDDTKTKVDIFCKGCTADDMDCIRCIYNEHVMNYSTVSPIPQNSDYNSALDDAVAAVKDCTCYVRQSKDVVYLSDAISVINALRK